MMKRCLTFVLLLALCCTLFASPALAVSATYSSTQAFLTGMDGLDIIYTLEGVNETSKYELVRVKNAGENFNYTLNYFFDEDLEHTGIRVWNVITYSEADMAKVMRVCNKLNADYKYCKFYVDESDNTVTAEMDLIYRTDSISDITLEATLHMCNLLDIAYEALSIYAQ